jgi:hypothetical protein
MPFFGILLIAATAFSDLGDPPPYFDYIHLSMFALWIVAGFFWVEGPRFITYLYQKLKR